MSKILFIGDVVGKPGRKALARVLPIWKEKYKPDVVIVNVENLAHGKGFTPTTLAEIDLLGIDSFTGGNHSFDKEDMAKACFEKYHKLIRPANLQGSYDGHGFYRFEVKGQQYLVINLHGQAFCEKFFSGNLTNPFVVVDELLKQEAQKGDIIFIDFHAEATSEKKTFGYYVDGRVVAVVGTHTHVPTADAHVMPKGTAYISDVGMVGTLESALGTKFENALTKFLDPSQKFKSEVEEEGVCQVNGVLITVESDPFDKLRAGKFKTESIEKLYEELP